MRERAAGMKQALERANESLEEYSVAARARPVLWWVSIYRDGSSPCERLGAWMRC